MNHFWRQSAGQEQKWGRQVAVRFKDDELKKLDALVAAVRQLDVWPYRTWTRSHIIQHLVGKAELPASVDELRGKVVFEKFEPIPPPLMLTKKKPASRRRRAGVRRKTKKAAKRG